MPPILHWVLNSKLRDMLVKEKKCIDIVHFGTDYESSLQLEFQDEIRCFEYPMKHLVENFYATVIRKNL